MPKIRRAYKQLNSMAFVANARPEQSDTHACSLNKGIGCKSRTRKESIAGLQSAYLRLQARGRIPKVAVILKYCFPCGESPRAVKTGHWKGCHGSERRLKQCVCAKKRTRSQRLQGFTRMNRSVRRPTNPETKNWQHGDSFLSAYLSIPLRSQEIQDTKAMVRIIIVFLILKILFILTGGAGKRNAALRGKE